MNKQQSIEIRDKILCYLFELPPGDKACLTDICEEIRIPMKYQKEIVGILDELRHKTLITIEALGSSAMICEITTNGKKVVKDIVTLQLSEDKKIGIQAPEEPRKSAVKLHELKPIFCDIGNVVHQLKNFTQNPNDQPIALFILNYDQQTAQYGVSLGLLTDLISCDVFSFNE